MFAQWADIGSEDLGVFEEATSAEEALAKAHARGIGWGLGYHYPRYQGMVARAVPGKLDRERHPILWRHFKDGTAWAEGVQYGEWVGRASDGVEVGLGMVCSEDQIERYLTAHPTQGDW